MRRGPEEAAADTAPAPKRPRHDQPSAEGAATAANTEGGGEGSRVDAGSLEDELEAMLGDAALKEVADEPLAAPEPPEEAARRSFAERLAGKVQLRQEDLTRLLRELRDEAPQWGSLRRLRSAALLLVYVARSSRTCRAAFVARGMPLLGEVLQEAIAGIEQGTAGDRQDHGMRVLACLTCLWTLPIGRATMWEHRSSVGKAFDRLHRWCGSARTALAAELRMPTTALCKRWKGQPRPALQDPCPEQRTVRLKVVDVLKLGLQGISGSSPASPCTALSRSPGILPPALVAAEVEAALFGVYGECTAEYRYHARMLKTNLVLPGNAPLRTSLLSGDMSARELVAMDHRSLAPEELRERRKAVQQEMLKQATLKAEEATVVVNVYDLVDQTYTPVVQAASEIPMADPEPSESKKQEMTQEEGSKEASSVLSPLLDLLPTPFREEDGGHPPTPLRSTSHALPPPTPDLMATPAQDGGPTPTPSRGAGHLVPPTPEMMATPAQEETEHELELIRWLSQKVV